MITEIDIDTEEDIGSYEEDYDVPDTVLGVRDFVKPEILPQGQFKDYWESIGANPKASEIIQSY